MKDFVFDMYGTLVDIRTDEQSPRFKKDMENYFRRLNPAITDFWGEYTRLCAEQLVGKDGNTENDLFAVFRRLVGGDDCKAMEAAEYFRRKSRSRLRVYPHIRKTLKALKAGGAGLYILSNAQSCFTLKELERLKLTKYFDGVELSSEFGEKKPSVRFFRHILDKYALDPKETLYIGNDFVCDILGADSAGLRAVYIKSNLSPESDCFETIKNTAVFAAADFKSLSRYLLNLCLPPMGTSRIY